MPGFEGPGPSGDGKSKEGAAIFSGCTGEELRQLASSLHVSKSELETRNRELREQRTELEHLRNSFARLFEFAPVGLLVVDYLGRIRDANAAAAAIFAGAAAHLRGVQMEHYVETADLDTFHALLTDLGRDGGSSHGSLRMRGRDGAILHIQVRAAPHPDRPDQALLALTDVTQQTALTKKLRRARRELVDRVRDSQRERDHAEALYQAVVEDQVEMICRYLADGTVTFANQAYCEYFGKTADEIVGTSWAPVIDGPDLPRVWAEVKRMTPEQPHRIIENRVLDGEGRVRWTRWINRAIFDENDNLVCYQSVGLDFDDEKRAQKEADQRRAALEIVYRISTRLERSFQSTCDEVTKSLADHMEVGAVSVLGWHGERAHPVSRFVDGELSRDETACCSDGPCLQVLRGGRGCEMSGDLGRRFPGVECLQKGQRTFAGVPIRTSKGQTVGALCAFDTGDTPFTETELQLLDIFANFLGFEYENEQLQQRLRAADQARSLGLIASGVAHEVRNPLNALLVTAEVLGHAVEQGKDCEKYVERIKRQVMRLSRLMSDLLELRKPVETDVMHLLPVERLLESAAELWRHNEAAVRNPVRIEVAAELHGQRVLVDEERIGQVLLNLIENASQHSPEGAPVVLHGLPAEGDLVRLLVCDRGAGIPEEQIPQVFDPFFTTRKGGTGLGLSIVRTIVERHGGSISLWNNRPPPGCTAEIRLPTTSES